MLLWRPFAACCSLRVHGSFVSFRLRRRVDNACFGCYFASWRCGLIGRGGSSFHRLRSRSTCRRRGRSDRRRLIIKVHVRHRAVAAAAAVYHRANRVTAATSWQALRIRARVPIGDAQQLWTLHFGGIVESRQSRTRPLHAHRRNSCPTGRLHTNCSDKSCLSAAKTHPNCCGQTTPHAGDIVRARFAGALFGLSGSARCLLPVVAASLSVPGSEVLPLDIAELAFEDDELDMQAESGAPLKWSNEGLPRKQVDGNAAEASQYCTTRQ